MKSFCCFASSCPGRLADGSVVRFRMAAAMWLAFLPWYLELYMGQTTFILMAATFILGAHLDDRTGSFHAGLWWTVSLITKPISLLFAPVLLQKAPLRDSDRRTGNRDRVLIPLFQEPTGGCQAVPDVDVGPGNGSEPR